MSSFVNKWWSGEVIFLGLSAVVLFLSVLMNTDASQVTVLGYTLPGLCMWTVFLGIECLGCGLTRSFVFMGHLDPVAAFDMNKLGPFLYVIVVAQVPVRSVRLVRGVLARRDVDKKLASS